MCSFAQVEDVDGSVTDGAVLCFKEDWRHLGIGRVEETHQENHVYAVFLGISDFFILVSFIVYLTVPDQTQRGLNKNVSDNALHNIGNLRNKRGNKVKKYLMTY